MCCNWRIINSNTCGTVDFPISDSPVYSFQRTLFIGFLVKNHSLIRVLQPQSGEIHTRYNWALLHGDKLCMNLMLGFVAPAVMETARV